MPSARQHAAVASGESLEAPGVTGLSGELEPARPDTAASVQRLQMSDLSLIFYQVLSSEYRMFTFEA